MAGHFVTLAPFLVQPHPEPPAFAVNVLDKYWNTEMKAWVFVWSAHDALPPQVLQVLQNLRNGKHGVTIDDWNREHLWTIVKALSNEVRSELLGVAPPQLGAPPDTTAAEIKVLLNFLTGRELNDDSVTFDLTDIAEKLQKNGLSDSVRALVTPAVPVARMVQDYIARHPDPDYSSRAAQALRRNDPLVGEVVVHFPKIGYSIEAV